MRLSRSDFIEVVKKTPLIAIDLIVKNSSDEVLLGLRNNEPAGQFWFVPGGRILKGERIPEAFKRIINEELGINASFEDAHFFGVFEHIYQNNFALEPGFGTHYIILAYELKIPELLNDLPKNQHNEFKWHTVKSLLNKDNAHPYTKAYFQ